MKKKLFTLMTFLLCAVGAAQADDVQPVQPVRSWDFTNISNKEWSTVTSNLIDNLTAASKENSADTLYNTAAIGTNAPVELTQQPSILSGLFFHITEGSKGLTIVRYYQDKVKIGGFLKLGSKNDTITIESLTKGQKIAIEYVGKGISAKNVETFTSPTTRGTHCVILQVGNVGSVTFNGSDGGIDIYSIKVYASDVDFETVTIGEYGVNTYSSANALDFTSAGINAYIAPNSCIDAQSNKVTLICATVVPAKTGIIIKSEHGDVERGVAVPIINSNEGAVKGEDNRLVAALESEGTLSVAASSTNDNTYNYIFGYGSSLKGNSLKASIGFYLVGEGGATSADKKAYLSLTQALAITNGNNANYFTLDFSDGDVTGISEVKAERRTADDAYYTLSGVKVANPQNGLYIHNGKKVIIK